MPFIVCYLVKKRGDKLPRLVCERWLKLAAEALPKDTNEFYTGLSSELKPSYRSSKTNMALVLSVIGYEIVVWEQSKPYLNMRYYCSFSHKIFCSNLYSFRIYTISNNFTLTQQIVYLASLCYSRAIIGKKQFNAIHVGTFGTDCEFDRKEFTDDEMNKMLDWIYATTLNPHRTMHRLEI